MHRLAALAALSILIPSVAMSQSPSVPNAAPWDQPFLPPAPEWLPLVIGLFVGWCAMYAVHWMMQSLHRLKSEGTARIEYSVGQLGEVYLRVPGGRTGSGKVTLTLQNRSVELV